MRKVIYSLILFVFMFGVAMPAMANVNESWDWHLVNGQKKRTLHYCAGTATRYTSTDRSLEIEAVEHGLPASWALWLTEAVENWNNSGSGWQFVPSEGLAIPPCQVMIIIADFNETITGGGMNQIMDTDGDGKMDLSTIVMDENLEDTLGNLPDGQDRADGKRDGWSTEGSEMTRDPVGVLKHELGHSLRLAHHADARQSAATDPDITDPRKPGDHKTDLSDADKQQAKDAFGQAVSLGNFTPCILRNHFNYNGIDVTFDAGSFADMNSMTISPLTGIAVPNPLQVPDGYSHVMNPATFFISTALPPLKPITIQVPYSDDELRGGEGKWIGDYHGLIPPALDQDTIVLLKYVPEPFGQELEGMSHWEILDGAVLDTENNTVTFQTMEMGIFGLTAKALPGELTIDEQIAASPYENGAAEADQAKPDAAEKPIDPVWYYVIIIVIVVVLVIAFVFGLKARKKK